MADETSEENAVGVEGLQNLQEEWKDDHVPGDFADEPRPAEPTTENVTAEDPTPELKTENVTAKDPEQVQDEPTNPHPKADEDPEEHIGDELPDPWGTTNTLEWNSTETDQKHAEVDASWDEALNKSEDDGVRAIVIPEGEYIESDEEQN